MSLFSNINPFSKNSDYGITPFAGDARKRWRGVFGSGGDGLTGRTNQYGVDYGSSTYAGDTYAALTRDQWQTYVSQFVPIENQLIDYATDRNKPIEAMQEASRDVNASYTAQQGATTRRLQGLGVTLDADEQQAQQRSFGLSKSLADVGAQNMAGALTRQRQQSILGNPAPQSSTTGMTGG